MALHEISRPFQRWIFICYSHRDRYWKDQVLTHLKPLEQSCDAEIFCDDRIGTGVDWTSTIARHLQAANAAILLISPAFLASEYICSNELPALISRMRENRKDLFVVPVIVSHCLLDETTFDFGAVGRTENRTLADLQAANLVSMPLECMSRCEQNEALVQVARSIATWFRELDHSPVGPKTNLPGTTRDVDVSRMPRGSSLFAGRDSELSLLDSCFQQTETRVATIVAQGGAGKSALASHWLRRWEDRKWDNAKVFAWSFYSQGTREESAATDEFIFEALKWFGDVRPDDGPADDKGERLADLILSRRSLLILDGLEPLQDRAGRVQDEAIKSLVTKLTRSSNGKNSLCLITTREPVVDLESNDRDMGIAHTLSLKPLAPSEGAWLLRLLGVKESDGAREKQSIQVHGHPLSLLLLGTYKRNAIGDEIGESQHDAQIVKTMPSHVQMRIACYERHFDKHPHRDILRMLGLFDRPAKAEELAALRRVSIVGLTERVHNLKTEDYVWRKAVNDLRRAGLVNEIALENPDGLDAHPLVREYFATRLQRFAPDAWRQGHIVLYEHLASKKPGDTLLDLVPFYQAVEHASQANILQRAMTDVYWRIIQREREGYAHRVHGAFATELRMLRSCFEDGAWIRPKTELSDFWQAHVLGIAGSRLRALGRLQEAVAPLVESLIRHSDADHVLYAAIRGRHLCELHVELGQLKEAVAYGLEAIRLAKNIYAPRLVASQKATYKKEQMGSLTPADGKYELIVANVVMASALHQQGLFPKAATYFGRAIAVLKKEPSWKIPALFGLWGFRYCEFLFDVAERSANRASALGKLTHQIKQMQIPDAAFDVVPEGRLGKIGKDLLNLIKVRAKLLDQNIDDEDRLAILQRAEEASNALRERKRRDFSPLGLLTVSRAARQAFQFDRAGVALREAEELVSSGTMKLYRADCMIERAWLEWENKKAPEREKRRKKALESVKKAAKIIREIGYGRREWEVKQLRRVIKG